MKSARVQPLTFLVKCPVCTSPVANPDTGNEVHSIETLEGTAGRTDTATCHICTVCGEALTVTVPTIYQRRAVRFAEWPHLQESGLPRERRQG